MRRDSKYFISHREIACPKSRREISINKTMLWAMKNANVYQYIYITAQCSSRFPLPRAGNPLAVGHPEEDTVTLVSLKKARDRKGENMRPTIQNLFIFFFYFKLQRMLHTQMSLYLTRSAEGLEGDRKQRQHWNCLFFWKEKLHNY